MVDTLPNIPLQANTWINLYDQTGITPDVEITVKNLGISGVRITVSPDIPPVFPEAFVNLSAGCCEATFSGIGVWVFSPTEPGSINVRIAGIPEISVGLPKTSFGELSVAAQTPIIQFLGSSGLTNKLEVFTTETGAVSTTGSGEITVSTGNGSTAISSINSAKSVPYRPGQGLKAIFTARFSVGAISSLQLAGLNNSGNGFNFGFIGADFGIVRRFGGKQEVQELEITQAATVAGVAANITVDDDTFNIVLNGNTTNQNAAEIASGLTSVVGGGWRFQQEGNKVTARQDESIAQGAFSFSHATAIATWAQLVNGQLASIDFIAQSNWNINTRDFLDKSKGNVYQIQMQYLGYGSILFSIEDSESGELEPVHRIQYANLNTQPSVENPTMILGINVINTGNTSDVTLHTASMAAFTEGVDVTTETSRSITGSDTLSSASGEVPLVTLRNRLTFSGGSVNLSEFQILEISASSNTDKVPEFKIYVNGMLTGDEFEFVDQVNSIASFDKKATSVTGNPIATITSFGNSTSIIKPKRLFIGPSDQITVTGLASSGASAEFTTTISFQEDI